MLNLAELNALEGEKFVHIIGPMFEHSPWIAERAFERRPFTSREELHTVLCECVRRASLEEKLSLIRAHPDLVGDTVLTVESQHEQKSAGLGSLSEDEAKQFRDYNARYRERFGFPFIICARLNNKETILGAFSARLEHSRNEEIDTALAEIYKIADLRLRDLVE